MGPLTTLDKIEPIALLSYLRAQGWQETERSDSRRSIWQHSSGVRVFVPARAESDFPDLVALALQQIAVVEKRDDEDIAVDLAWHRFDKLHLRRHAPASALPLGEALGLHDAMYDMIVAAARASSQPQRTYHGRRPASVDEYVDQVKLIPSVPGSFVIRALLPLDVPPEQEVLELVGPLAPRIRRISTTILTAASAAVTAAREVANGRGLDTWDDAVKSGVSANLCDALSRLPGAPGEGDCEVRIDWSWAAPADPSPGVTVNAGLAPVLAAGSDYLRDQPEEHSIRLTGLVTKLHRETATGPGEITVRGHIENWDASSRALRFQLDEATYRKAISAHDEGTSVRVNALVRRAPQGLEVLRVEDMQTLD